MDESLPKAAKRKDPEIAAAEWLLEGNTPDPSPRSGTPLIVPGGGEGFEVEGADAGRDAAPTSDPQGPEPGTDVRQRARDALPPTPAVVQVWTRSAEWGTTLLWLAGWTTAFLWLLYVLVNAEMYGLAGLLFGIGCVGGLLLCYPILITLERPVRITPEQAARDYFAALSHHLPHHRRMWLLLSEKGRRSSEFASYDSFKTYWKRRLAQLRDGHAGPLTPLVFEVDDFRSEKSAGRNEIDARFRLRVRVRGRREQGPIWSFSLERTFVRGPDGMWYLDDGTLIPRSEPLGSSG